MISKWRADNFIDRLARDSSRELAVAEIEDFLEQGELEDSNRAQRIVLVAEDFDFQVLATAEWLYESYDIDVRCYRLALATDGGGEFLTCARIYPPPELTEQAKRIGARARSGGQRPADWSTALQRIENPAVRIYFQSELDGAEKGRPAGDSFALMWEDEFDTEFGRS